MTAHVAERGEGRGRVVLRIGSAGPVSDLAIAAAVQIAKAYHAEIESIFVADRQVFDAAGYDFAREIRRDAQRSGPDGDIVCTAVDPDAIERQMQLASRAAQRRVSRIAVAADVPVVTRVVRDSPVGALARACQEFGPWNVVALAEPLTAEALVRMGVLFERVTGMTGILTVGPRASSGMGPVLAVVEDVERLPGMLRAAERIARVAARDVLLGIASRDRLYESWLATQVRELLAVHEGVELAVLGRAGGGTAVVAEAIRRLRPSFVIAEYGGIAIPRDGDTRSVTTAIACPLLVVR